MREATVEASPSTSGDGPIVSVRNEAGEVVVALRGDIDLANVDTLPVAISSLPLPLHDCVRIDLSEVSFLDATGLRALLRCEALLARAGVEVKVRNPKQAALRLLRLTHLDYLLETESPPPFLRTRGRTALEMRSIRFLP